MRAWVRGVWNHAIHRVVIAGAVMIFMRSRNASYGGDNSMYCMIPDPFPSSAFGKGSATPD